MRFLISIYFLSPRGDHPCMPTRPADREAADQTSMYPSGAGQRLAYSRPCTSERPQRNFLQRSRCYPPPCSADLCLNPRQKLSCFRMREHRCNAEALPEEGKVHQPEHRGSPTTGRLLENACPQSPRFPVNRKNTNPRCRDENATRRTA